MEALPHYTTGAGTWGYPASSLIQFPQFDHDIYDAEWEEFRALLRAKIDSLPSYSVARTLLEDDERFYLTFPGARRAAIDDWKMQQAAPAGTSGNAHFCSHSSATPVPIELPLHYDYDYRFPSEHSFQAHRPPVEPSYSSLQWVGGVRDHTVSLYPASDLPSVATHLVVPSQPRPIRQIDTMVPSFLEAHDQLESPVASSSRAVTPPRSPSPLASPIDARLRRTRSFTLSPPRIQYTGDWEADALAASRTHEVPAPKKNQKRTYTHPVISPHAGASKGRNGDRNSAYRTLRDPRCDPKNEPAPSSHLSAATARKVVFSPLRQEQEHQSSSRWRKTVSNRGDGAYERQTRPSTVSPCEAETDRRGKDGLFVLPREEDCLPTSASRRIRPDLQSMQAS